MVGSTGDPPQYTIRDTQYATLRPLLHPHLHSRRHARHTGEDLRRTNFHVELFYAPGILIKHRAANDSAYQAHLRGRFEAEGIEATRVQFRGTSPHAQMLAEYGDIDIALDPYPFNGGITSLEALWMGVPVLSLSGLRPVSRQGLAILKACRLKSWICETPQAFWRRAETACQDLQALQLQRKRLREQLLASLLNDAPRFAEALIRALSDGQLHQVGDQ